MKYDLDRQLYFYGPRIMEVVKGQKISKEIVFYIYIQQSLEIQNKLNGKNCETTTHVHKL